MNSHEILLDPDRRIARVGGRQLKLTPTEFRILECLSRQPGRAFSRDELMAACIAGGAIVLDRTFDQHVCALRRKLGDTDYVETVRNVGYRFRMPHQASARTDAARYPN